MRSKHHALINWRMATTQLFPNLLTDNGGNMKSLLLTGATLASFAAVIYFVLFIA
jgi:hypothetical protein